MSNNTVFDRFVDYTWPYYEENTLFTQKRYVAIADLIHKRRLEVKRPIEATGPYHAGVKKVEQDNRLDEINTLTLAPTKLFKEDNPKFKEFTFIEACNRDLKD